MDPVELRRKIRIRFLVRFVVVAPSNLDYEITLKPFSVLYVSYWFQRTKRTPSIILSSLYNLLMDYCHLDIKKNVQTN